jgi:dimethylhistidine N-methyltransferase
MGPANTLRQSERIDNDDRHNFAAAVVDGLTKARKSLPCRFLYDARGSELFEEITRLPEYYPTRTEIKILYKQAERMVEAIPTNGVLMEFGSGSSIKTELLLKHLPQTIAYVPIDVSPSALTAARQRLTSRFPSLVVCPIVGSFTDPIEVPASLAERPRTGFFPGSTIGNFTPGDAVDLMRNFRGILGDGGRLIVGVDLKKDARQLVLAYNDSAGVTAAFNLNLLVRINRQLGGTIDVSKFRHEAIYDPREGRIEMQLVSLIAQDISVCGRRFHFHKGESIHTENSYKYTVGEFQKLAQAASWCPRRLWTDDGEQFSVHELIACQSP